MAEHYSQNNSTCPKTEEKRFTETELREELLFLLVQKYGSVAQFHLDMLMPEFYQVYELGHLHGQITVLRELKEKKEEEVKFLKSMVNKDHTKK